MKSEQPQPQRMRQTMPEDGGGWHQINAGPHLHIMFNPNRQLLGREADGVKRPSIVVAVAGKREQALRFDPVQRWQPLSHPSEPARQAAAAVGRRGAEAARNRPGVLRKAVAVPRPPLTGRRETMRRRGWMTPTSPAPPGRSGNSTPPQDISPSLDGKGRAVAGTRNSLTARTAMVLSGNSPSSSLAATRHQTHPRPLANHRRRAPGMSAQSSLSAGFSRSYVVAHDLLGREIVCPSRALQPV